MNEILPYQFEPFVVRQKSAYPSPPPIFDDKNLCSKWMTEQASNAAYYDVMYGNQLLPGLHEKYKSGTFTDITLLVEHEAIQAHKIILCSFSSYFDAMLTGGMVESSQNEIRLQDVKASIARLLIEFAYTGCIHIDWDNVEDILRTSNFWSADHVQNGCCKFLKRHMDTTNCLGVLRLAKLYGLKDLYTSAKDLATKKFMTVTEGEEFQSLDLETMVDLLSEDKMCIEKGGSVPPPFEQEKFIFELIMKFAAQQENYDEKEVYDKLLPCVRWGLLLVDDKHLCRSVEFSEYLELAPAAREVVKKLVESRTATPQVVWREERIPGELRKWTSSLHGRMPQMTVYQGEQIDYSWESLQKDAKVTGMKLWFRMWGTVTVLGGIQVFFSNGLETAPKGGTNEEWDTYEFHLAEGEVITNIDVQSGWCVDNLTFHTNKPRLFGTYGGTGGELRPVIPPDSLPYLAWLKFVVVQSMEAPVITALKFGYRYYKVNNDDDDDDYFDDDQDEDDDEDYFDYPWHFEVSDEFDDDIYNIYPGLIY